MNELLGPHCQTPGCDICFVERLYDQAVEEGDACFGCAVDENGRRIYGQVDRSHGPDCPYLKKHGKPPARSGR